MSRASVLADLLPGRVDYDFVRENFLDRLEDSCAVADLGLGAQDDPYELFFRTDHHCTIEGALRVYERTAKALGLEPVAFAGVFAATEPLFNGSLARRGVDFSCTSDVVTDVAYERSALRVEVDGKEVDESFLDKGYGDEGYRPKSFYEDMYNGYYHPYKAQIHLVNEDAPQRTLLIVDDSYGHCMERFFAESYQDVYIIDRRGFEGTIAAMIDEHSIDDVLFLMQMSAVTDSRSIKMLE